MKKHHCREAGHCTSLQILACFISFAMYGMSTIAHENRPIYVEVTEVSPDQYRVRWKTPLSVSTSIQPMVSLPEPCVMRSGLAEFQQVDGLERRLRYDCAGGLAGRTIAIVYGEAKPSTASLIRYIAISGEQHTAVLGPQESSWTVPPQETALTVMRQYLLLGMQHIWSGVDHLLFLVCLLLVAGDWRRILITITGFTLAHSATLALSSLQIVKLPAAPVEVTIALSILFLAVEIVKGPRQTVTWRHPIAVSSSFGLLHGFGFAAALSEIGLPQTKVLTGLLFFNLGVETGQILVLGVCLLIKRMLSMYSNLALVRTCETNYLQQTAVYMVGTVSVFWLIQRAETFL